MTLPPRRWPIRFQDLRYVGNARTVPAVTGIAEISGKPLIIANTSSSIGKRVPAREMVRQMNEALRATWQT